LAIRTTLLRLVHLDSLSKRASAGYDRPAERRPAAAFDSVKPDDCCVAEAKAAQDTT
jgi:hypothetical protein